MRLTFEVKIEKQNDQLTDVTVRLNKETGAVIETDTVLCSDIKGTITELIGELLDGEL